MTTNLKDVKAGYGLTSTINSNNDTIASELDTKLSRTLAGFNNMEVPLDMGNNAIVNLPEAVSESSPVTLGQAAEIAGVENPLTTESVGAVLYPRTAEESAASIADYDAANTVGDITNPQYPPGDIRRYGAVDDGATDSTAAIQAAINAASHGSDCTIDLPAGHYVYDTLYVFHESTLNPNFLPDATFRRHGRFTLRGKGQMAGGNLKNYPPAQFYGTVLDSTGEGFIVAANRTVNGVAISHVGSPYPARRFEAFDITFIADNTTYVLENSQCPLIRLVRCGFKQKNALGNGVLMRSSWYMEMDGCWLKGEDGGVAITTGADEPIGQGIILIKGGSIDNWSRGVEHEEQYFANYRLVDIAIQNCSDAGFRLTGGRITNLTFDNVHFEGSTVHDYSIRQDAGTTINSLRIVSCDFNPGSSTTGYTQQAIISLDSPGTVDIRDNHVYRTFCPFVDIANSDTSRTVGTAAYNSIVHDQIANVPSPIFLFTGEVPSLQDNLYTSQGNGVYESGGKYRLFDETGEQPRMMADQSTSAFTINGLALGRVNVLTGVSSTINLTTDGNNWSVHDITNTTAHSMYLPNNEANHDGRLYIIKNNASSVGAISLRNGDFDLIASVAVGATCMVVLDYFNQHNFGTDPTKPQFIVLFNS